jgi:pimeloyl-ACP methyl ester carboxylesterase
MNSVSVLKWVKRVVIGVGALIVGLGVLGLAYQAVGAAVDARTYPPPGQLIVVGETRMHLDCRGDGSPTVILEALSGGNSTQWGWIQPEVAQITRVCSYDRAGRPWSEPTAAAPDLESTARNLHTLLTDANVPPPFILVGHSIGGIYARSFQMTYPDEVVGIVLLDSSHPEQLERYPEILNSMQEFRQLGAWFPALARLGLFRLYFATSEWLDFGELAEPSRSHLRAIWSLPEYHISLLQELEASPEIYADAASTLGPLGRLPLIVVSANRSQPAWWMGLQTELADLSENAIHRIADGATHGGLAFEPKYAHESARAILDMVEAVRTGTPIGP